MRKNHRVGVEFGAVLNLLGDKLYSNSHVFIRENVQNAIDALRLMELDERPNDLKKVEVTYTKGTVVIEDWGIGMTEEDVANFYWNIGKSSKKTKDAQKLKVIGQFGIGAFANFGVCSKVELTSWRKGSNKNYSKVLKSDLEKNHTDYHINDVSTIDHYGTIVKATLVKNPSLKDVKAYLKKFVCYLDEEIFFNGEIISTKKLPSLPLHNATKLVHSSINKDELYKLDLTYYKENDEGEVFIDILGKTNDKYIKGWLSTNKGNLDIYHNSFLISSNFNISWHVNSIDFSGIIDTDMLSPNAAREGLDTDSEEVLSNMLLDISKNMLETLSNKSFIYSNVRVVSYISDGDSKKLKNHIEQVSAPVYGRKKPLRLKEIVDIHKNMESEVLIVDSQEIPLPLRSSGKGQDVVIVQLSGLETDHKRIVRTFLKKHCKARRINDYEIKTELLKDNEITPAIRDIMHSIDDILHKFWGIHDAEIVPCKIEGEKKIYLNDTNGLIKVYVNVKSELFNSLLGYLGNKNFTVYLQSLLITPFLGEVLQAYIPEEVDLAIARFIPKPHEVSIKEIKDVKIVASKEGGWEGPTERCIRIISKDFPTMEGTYIKLPDHIVNNFSIIFASAESYHLHWFGDTAIFIFEGKERQPLIIEAACRDVILNKKKLSGLMIVEKNVLLFKTGGFIYIPTPQLKALLPSESPRILEFSFRNLG
jgi:molecular chaperone HtpG